MLLARLLGVDVTASNDHSFIMLVIRFRFGCLSREGFDRACRRFLKIEPGLFPGQPVSSFCFLLKNVGYPDGTFGIKS